MNPTVPLPGLPVAHAVRNGAAILADHVALSHDERLLRRRRLVSQGGLAFLVDLPQTVTLQQGQALELADGRLIGVLAAPEALVQVQGDLPRLAWHIGNRHTPCQIGIGCLIVRAERVMEAMLRGLGATLTPLSAPFFPEGGAYGPAHGQGHGHGHQQGPGHQMGPGHQQGQGHQQGPGHQQGQGDQQGYANQQWPANQHANQHGHQHANQHGHQRGQGQS